MTRPDLMRLLAQHVHEKGQAQVARELGYSSSTISQVMNGKYPGNLDNLLERVKEVYGSETVHCPILGEIPLAKCAEHRRRPFAATNPMRVQLYRACRECERRNS